MQGPRNRHGYRSAAAARAGSPAGPGRDLIRVVVAGQPAGRAFAAVLVAARPGSGAFRTDPGCDRSRSACNRRTGGRHPGSSRSPTGTIPAGRPPVDALRVAVLVHEPAEMRREVTDPAQATARFRFQTGLREMPLPRPACRRCGSARWCARTARKAGAEREGEQTGIDAWFVNSRPRSSIRRWTCGIVRCFLPCGPTKCRVEHPHGLVVGLDDHQVGTGQASPRPNGRTQRLAVPQPGRSAARGRENASGCS